MVMMISRHVQLRVLCNEITWPSLSLSLCDRLQGDITFTDEQGQVWRGKINDAATERRPGQPTWTPTPPNAALLRKVLV